MTAKQWIVVCAGVLVAAFLPALQAPALAQQVIYACVNPSGNGVRIVAESVPCKSQEIRVQWNVATSAGSLGSIKGQLKYTCLPATDFLHTLVYVPGHAFSVFTGADGAFQMDLVPPGTYEIRIERNGQLVGQASNVVVDMAINNGVVDLQTLDLNDLQTDPANCGVCGNACAAGAICTAGQCGAAPCGPGQTSCNGVCVSLSNNVNNCGACGNVCPAGANSVASCNASTCSLQCTPGFQNCNLNNADGCEVHLATDVNNCGACNQACGAGQSCVAGVCATQQECSPGSTSSCPLQQGVCAGSLRTCLPNGTWGACNAPNYSPQELCDGLDNNCNGTIDIDGFPTLGHACENGGVQGVVVCAPNGQSVVCSAGGGGTLLTDGAACGAGLQCQSGSCTDGVCCNSTCGGSCQACTAAKKGSGVDGVCGAIAIGADPDAECTSQPSGTCGTTGVCNGAGACQLYPVGTQCSATTCVGGTQFNASTCSGTGTCVAGSSTPCSPYVCGITACLTSCATNANCASPFVCGAGGQCVPPLEPDVVLFSSARD